MNCTTPSKRQRIQPTASSSSSTIQHPTATDDAAIIIAEHQSTVITIDDDAASAEPPPVITVENNDLAPPEFATPDLDLAFQLQMEEAIAASAARSDTQNLKRPRDEFDLQLHDRKVAEEIINIPDDEWQATGDDYHRPYAFGSTSSIGGSDDLGLYEPELFSLCFRGLVVEDLHSKAKLGAIGLAILSSRNAVVFEVSKPLILPQHEMTDEVAQLEAFVLGLEYAFSLELRRLGYFCLDFDVDQYLDATEKPKDAKVAELVQSAGLLKKRFLQCHSSVATKNNAAEVIVSQLARSSIEKQQSVVVRKEACPICLEDIDSGQMFEIGKCRHSFCYSCLLKHVQLRVLERELPRCPEPSCGLELDMDCSRKFLSEEMYHVIDQLVKESSIAAADKVYCPNPKCSNLMSKKDDAMKNSENGDGPCECVKCHTQFCVDCKVPWHSNLSCDAYKSRKTNSSSDDAKLQRLAGDEKWRQCPRCSHMVELALGCNHIQCRCGHQFCYLCGSEWKQQRTCSCPLWSEDKIIIGGAANVQ